MSSETREIVHDQHAHPDRKFYLIIGVILLVLTALEVVGYVLEDNGTLPAGAAAVIILALSAAKFVSVVAYYMHLKFDNKLFTGIFIFPALLGTLVISGMLILFHVVHGEATAIHGFTGADAAAHESAPAPTPR